MSVLFEEVRLSLPHLEVAAHLYGPDDGKPVIALHGWLDNAATFSRLAPRLQGLRIVALDLPGHGHSDHRPIGAGYNIWDYAHDVLQVAEQAGSAFHCSGTPWARSFPCCSPVRYPSASSGWH